MGSKPTKLKTIKQNHHRRRRYQNMGFSTNKYNQPSLIKKAKLMATKKLL